MGIQLARSKVEAKMKVYCKILGVLHSPHTISSRRRQSQTSIPLRSSIAGIPRFDLLCNFDLPNRKRTGPTKGLLLCLYSTSINIAMIGLYGKLRNLTASFAHRAYASSTRIDSYEDNSTLGGSSQSLLCSYRSYFASQSSTLSIPNRPATLHRIILT